MLDHYQRRSSSALPLARVYLLRNSSGRSFFNELLYTFLLDHFLLELLYFNAGNSVIVDIRAAFVRYSQQFSVPVLSRGHGRILEHIRPDPRQWADKSLVLDNGPLAAEQRRGASNFPNEPDPLFPPSVRPDQRTDVGDRTPVGHDLFTGIQRGFN